ncbi:hypothetical protein SBOR_2039 [Sclerotinia borealis F-4128]|uniref:Uncharacterized protein n=1 Tax=Sclerotinia borealis (strain F-4128) TaxID=1432307 RepID=W9CLA1_SCLBF|nr:hypothetical protein SBOR_2039 [Sclerotinia borealis F-4128]
MDENGEYGREPTEREISAAEMEAIHQAMMEELGLGRKDALPLEDRAADVSMVPMTSTTKRVRPENPASAWQNFSPDDVEPGLGDLSDIAGGQLYRLRRGGSGLSNGGRGGHSAGRGRGGASSRGGHVSVGGRENLAAKGRNFDHSRSSQTHSHDTRSSAKSRAAVDSGIARLQREAEFSKMLRSSEMMRTEGRAVKMPSSAPRSAKPVLRAASHAVTGAASSAVTRPTVSKFKLVSSAAFLSHANISSSPTTRAAEPVISAPRSNTGNVLPPATSLKPQQGLESSIWAPSPAAPQLNTDNVLPSASSLKPQQGLESSIWAPSPTAPQLNTDNVLPSASSLKPQYGLESSIWAPSSATLVNTSEPNHHDQSAAPLISTSISASSNSAQSVMPTVGMNISESNYSLRSGTSAIPTNTSKSNHSFQSGTVATHLDLVTDSVSIQRRPFVMHTVVDERNVKYSKNNSLDKPGIVRLVKSDERSPLTLELQVNGDIVLSELLTETTEIKVQSNFLTYRADPTTEQSPTWKFIFQLPGPAKGFLDCHTVTLSELRRNGCSSQSSEQGRQSSRVPLSPVPSSTISCSSKTTSRNDVTYLPNIISSSTYADLAELDCEETLFSLQEEENQLEDDQVETYSSLQDLLSLMEGDILSHTLQVLNKDHGGSFVDHVYQLAKGTGLENDPHFMERAKNAIGGGLSSSCYSTEKPILTVTEELVADFLKKSKTLSQFPAEFLHTYTKEISKKILDKAQEAQNLQVATQLATASFNTSFNSVQAPEIVEDIKPVEAVKPGIVIKSVGTSDIIPRQVRIAYSVEEMFMMRPNATYTTKVLAARDSLEKYLASYKRGIASADIIQTTDSGVRIVAGRSRESQYKDSHRDTATKAHSSAKTRFASTASNQEVPQVIQQDKSIEKQIPEPKRLTPESLSDDNANHISTELTSRQDSFGKGDGTPFSKISPAEWKARFRGTLSNHTSSTITKVKEITTTGNKGSIKNDVLACISVEDNLNKSTADTRQQSLSDKSSGTSFIASQATTHNNPKSSTTAAESEVKLKAESGRDTSPLVLPTNRGRSTSRYATPNGVSQAAILRGMSGYNTPPRQVVERQESSNGSSESSTALRLTQVHDTLLWEASLSSKQTQTSIKEESPEAPKNGVVDIASTSESGKPMPVTISHKSVLKQSPTNPLTQSVSKVDNASNFKQIPEFKVVKQTEAPATVVGTAASVTVDISGNQMAKTVGYQETNPVAYDMVTRKEKTVSKVENQLPIRRRHTATNSDVDRLAQVLSNLDVKTEKNNDIVIDGLPIPERSISPTIEEILEKKRNCGLSTSIWATPEDAVFKPASRTPQSNSTGYGRPSLTKPQHHRHRVFSPHNNHQNPAMQAQVPYGDFLQHGNQYTSTQGQTSHGYHSPGFNQQYLGQRMQHQQPLYVVFPAVLVTGPVTSNPKAVTGIPIGTHGPSVAKLTSADVGYSPSSVRGFTPSSPSSFPPRPTMLDRSSSDSDNEDTLKATAPVFTPSRHNDGSTMNRPALSPLLNRLNAQQKAVQARLNKSLAER